MRLIPLLLALLATGFADEVARELRTAEPIDRPQILATLPDRMAERSPAERASLGPLLLAILGDPDREALHASSIRALVATETDRGIREALVRHYSRVASPVRMAAHSALAEVGGPEATRRIALHLSRDRSPRARAMVALILGRRGDRAAGERLLVALGDPDPIVRAAAAEALTRIYGRCRGYEPERWRPLVEKKSEPLPAGPGKAGTPGAPGERSTLPRTPGEVVTLPAPPPGVDDEVARLVPDFFGIPLDRQTVVVVLDFSGSVRGEGGKRVVRVLENRLSLLPTIRRLTVLAFDERLLPLRPAPERATPDLKLDLRRFLLGLPPGRRTEILLPVRTGLALAERAEEGGAQLLIVSDGAPTVDGPPLLSLVEQADRLDAKKVRIDAAVFEGREVGLFRFLTRTTKGSYVALPSAR